MSSAPNTANNWIERVRNEPACLNPANDFPATWLERFASDGYQQLKTVALPSRKMERWRYTPVTELFKQTFAEQLPSSAQQASLETDIDKFFEKDLQTIEILIVNGLVEHLRVPAQLPEGVIIESLGKAAEFHGEKLSANMGKAMNYKPASEPFNTRSEKQNGRLFDYLNQSSRPEGIFIYVPAGIKLDMPIEITQLQHNTSDALIQTHCVVVVENNAAMTLIEKHVGQNTENSFSNHQLELILNERAVLNHYCLQDQSQTSWHRQGMYRLQANQSEYNGWAAALGGQWSRIEINAFFTGEKAVSNLHGIQLAGTGQVNDIHIDTRHEKPDCESEQHFRGLAYGKGKIVFDGNIFVAADAQKTAAHLSDKNLMLSRDSEVDAKPQLEIYADDVQCSHGTSIGELDEQQVFYLQSRGINKAKAKTLLSIGYVAQMLDSIAIDSLRETTLDCLHKHLSQADNVSEVMEPGNDAS